MPHRHYIYLMGLAFCQIHAAHILCGRTGAQTTPHNHAPYRERRTSKLMLTFGPRLPSWQKCVGNMFYVRGSDASAEGTHDTRAMQAAHIASGDAATYARGRRRRTGPAPGAESGLPGQLRRRRRGALDPGAQPGLGLGRAGLRRCVRRRPLPQRAGGALSRPRIQAQLGDPA